MRRKYATDLLLTYLHRLSPQTYVSEDDEYNCLQNHHGTLSRSRAYKNLVHLSVRALSMSWRGFLMAVQQDT